VWDNVRLPAWIRAVTHSLVSVVKTEAPPVQIDREVPLMFVDVRPHQATTEAPNTAKFYSDKNSQAANPDADRDTDMPKITGVQTQVARTEDNPHRFDKLQPAPPVERAPPAYPVRPKPVVSPGDLTLAKPEPNPRPESGKAAQAPPRKLAEARARQASGALPGQKMKQEGGVRRRLEFSSLDAKATPFGLYDRAFIEAVQQRWDDLLESISFDGYRRGKVVLQFHLNYDGRIAEMRVVENNVGEMLGLLCQKAVLDPAPFDKWPREMRLIVGQDYRQIQFTFYYN
jgi:hypothetical protein